MISIINGAAGSSALFLAAALMGCAIHVDQTRIGAPPTAVPTKVESSNAKVDDLVKESTTANGDLERFIAEVKLEKKGSAEQKQKLLLAKAVLDAAWAKLYRAKDKVLDLELSRHKQTIDAAAKQLEGYQKTLSEIEKSLAAP